ncbi:MAG: hypothetical protein H6752_13030 [Candidatus Omnitrophica bacterium]|nr:hypothetical protein [Candidatus Omnitrophota bacterium]
MNDYHLIRYETDPTLLSMYHYAIHTHWRYEKSEKNAFTHFVYAACCLQRNLNLSFSRTSIGVIPT